jgi:hypothetical protein
MITSDTTIESLLGTSIKLSLAGQTIEVSEMSVRQTLQLLQHREAIAALDFTDIPKLLAEQQTLMVSLMGIMLSVDQESLLNAKNSELMAALQASIALNKTFFLQAVQSVVAAMQVKAAIQIKLTQAMAQAAPTAQPTTTATPPTQPAGPAPSASSLPQATASATFIATPPVNSTPIPGLPTS